jgi:hypothetical protein
MKERSEHVHEAAQGFFIHIFEGFLFPESTEMFLGTLPSVKLRRARKGPTGT